MPDESCRFCGGVLVNCSSCQNCRKMTQRICDMCNSKTPEQVHSDCLYLETSKSGNSMEINVVTHSQSKREISRKNSEKYPLRNALLAFGIVSFFVLALAITNYFALPQSQASEGATMKTISQIQNHDDFSRFENCLAYGSGQSMTITCPTEYGNIYSAILTIPQKLASEFSNQVFSVRGVSVVEYSDGSVVLQYRGNLYHTKFLAN